MHSIANGSPRVDSFRNQYRRVLLGGRTILSGIANSSAMVDCFRNLYRRVRMMPGKRAHDLHDIANTSSRVDTSIARYAGLMLGGGTIFHGIANSSLRIDCFRNQYHRVRRVTAR